MTTVAWTPNQLGSALVGWFDLTDATKVTTASGNVSSVTNQASGSAVTFGQATAANRPAYTSGVGYTVPPTGAKALTLANLPAGEYTLLIVGTDGSTNYSTIWSDPSSGNEITVEASSTQVQAYTTSAALGQFGSQVWPNSTLGMMVLDLPATGAASINRNGNAMAAGGAVSKSTSATIGNLTSGGEGFGVIRLVMVVAGAMTTANRQYLEGWAAHLPTIGVALVPGHPWQSASPTITLTPSTGTLNLTLGALTVSGSNLPPAVNLPVLTTPGCTYKSVVSFERLLPSYTGNIAYANDGGSGSSVQITGATGIAPSQIGSLRGANNEARLYGLFDQSGNGNDADSHSGQASYMPAIREDGLIGGKVAILIDGCRVTPVSTRGLEITNVGIANLDARAEFMVLDANTTIMQQMISNAGTQSAFYTDPADGNGLINASHGTTTALLPSCPIVVMFSESPSGAFLWINGTKYPITQTQQGGAVSLFQLGWTSQFGIDYNSNIRVGAWGHIDGTPSDTDMLAINAALTARFTVPTTHALNVTIGGDSIGMGFGSTDTFNALFYLRPQITQPATWWNFSVDGRTMATCYADIANNEALAYDSTAGVKNVAIIEAGFNDLGAGAADPTTLYNGTATPYIAALKALGYKVGICTLWKTTTTAFSTGQDSTINANIDTYNGLVRANAGGADFIIDQAADSVFGNYPTSQNDPTLFFDGLHPTSLGYQRVASLWAPKINAAIGGVSHQGTLTATLGAMSAAAIARAAVRSSGAPTLGALKAAGAATHAVRGVANIAFGGIALSAQGKVITRATSGVSLAPMRVSSGTAKAAGRGTVAVTLAALHAAPIAGARIGSRGTLSLSALRGAAAGGVRLTGQEVSALGSLHVAGIAGGRIKGGLATTLGPAAVLSTVTSKKTALASLRATLGAVAVSAAGRAAARGVATSTLGPVQSAAAGKARTGGSVSAALAPMSVSAIGTATAGGMGHLAATLGQMAAVGTVRSSIHPAAGIQLAGVRPQGAGKSGIRAATAGALTGAVVTGRAALLARGGATIELGRLMAIAAAGLRANEATPPERILLAPARRRGLIAPARPRTVTAKAPSRLLAA
jgi:lysophospholipase L1-like esterase